jgi:hypothetical protein
LRICEDASKKGVREMLRGIPYQLARGAIFITKNWVKRTHLQKTIVGFLVPGFFSVCIYFSMSPPHAFRKKFSLLKSCKMLQEEAWRKSSQNKEVYFFSLFTCKSEEQKML